MIKKFKLKNDNYLDRYQFVIRGGIFYAIENEEFNHKGLKDHLPNFHSLPDKYKVKAVQVARHSQPAGTTEVYITQLGEGMINPYIEIQINQYKHVTIKEAKDFDHRLIAL